MERLKLFKSNVKYFKTTHKAFSTAEKGNYVTALGNAFSCFKKTEAVMFLCKPFPIASRSVPSMSTALRTNLQGSGFAVHEGLVAGCGNPE